MKPNYRIQYLLDVVALLCVLAVWGWFVYTVFHDLLISFSMSIKYYYSEPDFVGFRPLYTALATVGGTKFAAIYFLSQSLVGWKPSLVKIVPALASQVLIIYVVALLCAASIDPTHKSHLTTIAVWPVALTACFVLFGIYQMFSPPRRSLGALFLGVGAAVFAFDIHAEAYSLLGDRGFYFLRAWRFPIVLAVCFIMFCCCMVWKSPKVRLGVLLSGLFFIVVLYGIDSHYSNWFDRANYFMRYWRLHIVSGVAFVSLLYLSLPWRLSSLVDARLTHADLRS